MEYIKALLKRIHAILLSLKGEGLAKLMLGPHEVAKKISKEEK